MPLSKKKDKARKRLERAIEVVQPKSNLLTVQPDTLKQEKLTMLREIIANPDALKSKSSPLKSLSSSRVPLYNPRIHKQGDVVRMRAGNGKLIEIVVPELDAEGNPVW